MSKEIKESDVVSKWQSLQSSAKSREIPFTITLKHVRKLLEQKTCFFTHQAFVEGHPQLGRSIDRVETTGPYSDDNTVACTIASNNAKGCSSIELLEKILAGMKKHRIKMLKKQARTPKKKST